MPNKPLYPISVLSRLLNVHQRTLRIYDSEGLLVPSRTLKNRRLYSQDDIKKAKLILYLTRNLALNLSGVKTVLSILKELKVRPNHYTNLINKISIENNFNEKENIKKAKNRGRKANLTQGKI